MYIGFCWHANANGSVHSPVYHRKLALDYSSRLIEVHGFSRLLIVFTRWAFPLCYRIYTYCWALLRSTPLSHSVMLFLRNNPAHKQFKHVSRFLLHNWCFTSFESHTYITLQERLQALSHTTLHTILHSVSLGRHPREPLTPFHFAGESRICHVFPLALIYACTEFFLTSCRLVQHLPSVGVWEHEISSRALFFGRSDFSARGSFFEKNSTLSRGFRSSDKLVKTWNCACYIVL